MASGSKLTTMFPLSRKTGAACFALAMTCLAFAPGLAPAREGGVIGRIDATAYAEVPPGATIWVRPAGAAPLSLEVARGVAEALRARGHRIQAGAGHYVLSLRLATNLDLEPPPDTWIRLEDNAIMVRPKLRAPEARRIPVWPRIILADLRDGEGNLVWSARASLVSGAGDPDLVIDRLLPALIGEMFRSTYDKAVH